MDYTYIQLENGDWEIAVPTESTYGTIMFILSADPDRGLPEHAQMIQDFQDTTKLEYFIQLLIDNPSTAFLTYLGLNVGS